MVSSSSSRSRYGLHDVGSDSVDEKFFSGDDEDEPVDIREDSDIAVPEQRRNDKILRTV